MDFHNYCRVIMHWNLPGNPIDLEQREGRINRFKCLAIRQNVADKYGKAVGMEFKREHLERNVLKLQKRKSRMINQNLYHSGALGKIRV